MWVSYARGPVPAVQPGWIVGLRSRRGDRHRLRPGLLELEERRLLATFTVTSTADDGSAGTLRWAIAEANATPGPNTIDFDPTVFSTPQTITLSWEPARAEQHQRDADDHRPGRGRDDQRRRPEPGLPGRRGGDGVDLGPDHHRRHGGR